MDYQVRYVRNITDVGHLLNDADEGEDKIVKKAKLDNIKVKETEYNPENYWLRKAVPKKGPYVRPI